jgi:hypothetical protein
MDDSESHVSRDRSHRRSCMPKHFLGALSGVGMHDIPTLGFVGRAQPRDAREVEASLRMFSS